jgi:hypothetical protein
MFVSTSQDGPHRTLTTDPGFQDALVEKLAELTGVRLFADGR